MTQRTSFNEGVGSCRNTTKEALRPLSMVFSESSSIQDSGEAYRSFTVRFGRSGRGKLPKVTELEVNDIISSINRYFYTVWKHIDGNTVIDFTVSLSRDLVIVLEEEQYKEIWETISSVGNTLNELKPFYRLNFWTN